MTYKKKLIEVALPLDAINREAAREKSIRHGHPSTLHLWWARRPLAAARAVLWASLVNDPSADVELFPTLEAQETERQRLFRILEQLVRWENSDNQHILDEATKEILDSCDGELPTVLDPFCGGGSIPLEAQRLGLPAFGGDLNPVAVLVSKAMIEIPPRFDRKPPMNPEARQGSGLKSWRGAQGLAEDVRYYGLRIQEQAFERIGSLYPKVRLPASKGSEDATAIAWIWARTVASPDPAWSGDVPLVRSWTLRSATKSKPSIWIEPIIDRHRQEIRYAIREGGEPPEGTIGRSTAGRCVATGTPFGFDYVRQQGRTTGFGRHAMAAVAQGPRGREYVAGIETPALPAVHIPSALEAELPRNPRDFKTPGYGLGHWKDLFTDRQLLALTTFSDQLQEVRMVIERDAQAAGLTIDGRRLRDGGDQGTAYADAVMTYLAFVLDKCADYWSTVCTWHNSKELIRNTFARQAIPMTWDFAEVNPFSGSTGSWRSMLDWVAKAIEHLPAVGAASVAQRDATARVAEIANPVVVTDPPYYDNIGYSDLSDFFYVWLRTSLRDVWPDELSTVLTPKAEELIADPYRHGSNPEARAHFEAGMKEVFSSVAAHQNPDFPSVVFYAFKQAETDASGTASTGWETFLQGLRSAGLAITSTWPVRTELVNRPLAMKKAALASSIVIACRPQHPMAPLATRGEFLAALRRELPPAIRLLQRESIAPVDMAQSAIGPGMAVFSRFSKVIESDGTDMPVRHALTLINEVLQEVLSEEETEFDADTRWALTWYEQNGMKPGLFGDAETLSKAKNTSVGGVVQAGIAVQQDGKVYLVDRDDLVADWDPSADTRLTVWEVTQNLIASLDESELVAANLLRWIGTGIGERARQLAYLLYQAADRRGWAEEAVAYNTLVQAWPDLVKLASRSETPVQQRLGE
ncbi:MAG: DUF1156 domain-containing protein [Acidimicrobiia bacterium]|nr:DUF1156 domain-containing protein [Acidimicrobiia bacterium]